MATAVGILMGLMFIIVGLPESVYRDKSVAGEGNPLAEIIFIILGIEFILVTIFVWN